MKVATGAAVLAKAKGFDVFVSDFSSIKPKYKDMLDAHGICWEEGRHTEADILNADEIIKSPGIPDKAPIIKKLKEKGTPIISEIEFAGRYTDAKMICIHREQWQDDDDHADLPHPPGRREWMRGLPGTSGTALPSRWLKILTPLRYRTE